MAISFDASSFGDAATGTSLTYSHTVGSGSNRILFVGIGVASGDNLTSITYAGSNMLLADKILSPASNEVYLYYQLNPASGTNNVVINVSGGATFIRARSTSYSGAAQVAPEVTNTQSQTAASITNTFTTLSDNDWAVTVGGMQRDPAAGTNATLRVESNGVGIFDSNGAITPAGSFSMTLTYGVAAGEGQVMAGFAPFAASAKTPLLSLLGVGL